MLDKKNPHNDFTVEVGGMLDTEAMTTRTTYDALRVYVNDEYVGDKSMIGETNEESEAIDGYLRNAGFQKYQISNEENRFNIIAEGNHSLEIKNAIKGYLDLH